MAQMLVDLVMKKASGFFGKPSKEGWSWTVGPEGETMVWWHHTW